MKVSIIFYGNDKNNIFLNLSLVNEEVFLKVI